jgi:ribosome-associated protein
MPCNIMAAEPLITARGIVIGAEELDEQFIRASGPGGQNVNKVATAVQLRFDARNSPSLDERVRARLIALAGRRATRDGVIVLEASRFRTQERNRADALRRLADLIDEAAEPPPPPRKKTRPSRGAVEQRLKEKAGRGRVKKLRGRIDNADG